METDALLSTLPTCLTISNKHFLLECHLKGHLHLRMEELLQPVETFDIKVMKSIGLTQYSLKLIFKVIFYTEKGAPFLKV